MRKRALMYAVAILVTVLATLLRMALAPLVGAGVPFATYFLAVLWLAWYAGLGPTILSIVLSAVAGTYFFVSPSTRSAFVLAGSSERATIAVFILASVTIAFLLQMQRRTLDRIEQEARRRREAEEAERQARRRFEITLASIGDAVIATDEQANVTFMNGVATALTGWDAAEATGLPLQKVFHIVNEQTGAEVPNPIDAVIQKGAVVGLANHTLLLSKDGRRIPIDDSGAPIRHEGGTVGAVLVFRDVTERRTAQQQIERSERHYRLLFENNPQPMWVYDRETLSFLTVNHAAVQHYGYSAEEFLKMTLKDIRPAEDIPALLENVSKPDPVLHRDGPWRHRKRDGSIITVEITTHPINFDGRKASLVLASDITERRQLEEQFQQSQRLESIGRLAGGVAHDFNNLLTVINGYAAMILADVPKDTTIARRVGQISAAGQQAAALTEQLLAFSRRQLIEPKALNVNDVIRNMESMVRRLIGEDVELVATLAPDLGRIKADTNQLQQVVLNLAVNARDAMPQGGSLILETANVFLDEEYCARHRDVQPGPYILLAVTDTGTGMTAEVQARIFEPFFTTKPVGSGTGLGLATVHGMVRQSGGWIWVYSEPGSGTTFKIYFPRTGEAVAPPPHVIESDVRGSETILVVEDQEDVRALAVAILERYGYQVLSAAGGEQAIELARNFQDPIHLLLTDVVMAGMDGRTLARQLASGRTLRVLFMSGYTENAIAHRGILDAGLDYIQKPFTPQSLAEKVREVLNRQESSFAS